MGAIIQNGNIGAIIKNGIVYGGGIVDGEARTIVSSSISYEGYGESGIKSIHLPLLLKENDTVVFAITSRSTLTLPTGVVQLYESVDTWNTVNQKLTFAKYTANQDELKEFAFYQSSENRFFVSYCIFNDVTVTYSGNFNMIYDTTDSSRIKYDVPNKTDKKMLFWTFSVATYSGGNAVILKSNPNDIYRISWISGYDNTAPRHVSFLDDGTGAITRYFETEGTGYNICEQTCVIDALEITKGYTPPTPSGADGLTYNLSVDNNYHLNIIEYDNGVQSQTTSLNDESLDYGNTPVTFGDLIISYGTGDVFIIKPNYNDNKSIKYNDVLYSGDNEILSLPDYYESDPYTLTGWIE